MTTPDVKKIVQRLERVEKQNHRYKVINVFAFFLFLCFMVAPQLSAISVPGLDSLKNAVDDINDFIKFEYDLKSKKFVAQGASNDDKPRIEMDQDSLDFYDTYGKKRIEMDKYALTINDSNGQKRCELNSNTLMFTDSTGKSYGYLRGGSGGKIGINKADPKRALHVSDKGTMVQLRFERTGSSPGVVEMGTANNNFYFYPGGYSKKNGNAIFDTTGYVGIGVHTPQAKLHVNGRVKANNINTGDIVFQKDGQKLWRMFEDEKGLYLENIKTKKVYSFVLKEVK